MSLQPVEIPLGAMRFNSDSSKLEYWNGSAWFQIETFSPNLDGGTRGIFTGMGAIPNMSPYGIQYITIPTQGNSVDFGDMVDARSNVGSFASNVRGVFGGGYSPTPDNDIDFVTIASTGNASDFGNMNYNAFDTVGASNQTRGLFFGGSPNSSENGGVNSVDFVTIATTANAVDFGDLFLKCMTAYAGANPVRAVVGNGKDGPAHSNVIFKVNMATLGNSSDFGDQTISRHTAGGCSNAVRMVFGGGSTPTKISSIETLSLATEGNSLLFGDLGAAKSALGATCDATRAVFGAGIFHPETHTNNLEYISIATGGNSIDFGDLLDNSKTQGGTGFSNGHGGLG